MNVPVVAELSGEPQSASISPCRGRGACSAFSCSYTQSIFFLGHTAGTFVQRVEFFVQTAAVRRRTFFWPERILYRKDISRTPSVGHSPGTGLPAFIRFMADYFVRVGRLFCLQNASTVQIGNSFSFLTAPPFFTYRHVNPIAWTFGL